MATNSGNLVAALIAGGLSAAAARVVANAIANASTPQFSRGGDVADATPSEELRMIAPDARRYQFTNLDYSPEAPRQQRLQSYPGRFAPADADHPYKDAQPVQPVPPLSGASVEGGDYITVENMVKDNAPLARASLKLSLTPGTHLRINRKSMSCEAVPITTSSPQGLVTATIEEASRATNIEMAVRQLQPQSIVTASGATVPLLTWGDPSGTPGTAWSNWVATNLLNVSSQAGFNTSALGLSVGTWTPVYTTYTPFPFAQGSDLVCTYSSETGGWYVKFQSLVIAIGTLKTSARSAAGSLTSLGISGLPFQYDAPSGNAPFYASGIVGFRSGFVTNGITHCQILTAQSLIRLFDGTSQSAFVEQSTIPTAAVTELQFTVIYRTNS